MKIIVDKLPETPRDCLFSKLTSHGYVCNLRAYITKVNQKPVCLCKSVDKCNRLIFIGDVKYE